MSNQKQFEIVELEERLEMAALEAGDGNIEPLKCDDRCSDNEVDVAAERTEPVLLEP